MRLNAFSDYSLRVLIYLALNPDRLATIAEIARGYDISENHLMKVVHHLGRTGYVETVRGKGGGMRLGRAPKDIVLGEVLRQTETDFDLVECFSDKSTCAIQHVCRLQDVFGEARNAMFLVLDAYTLADMLEQPKARPGAIKWKPGKAATPQA
jgi:Rrf2 family nitric oxide-sensitive transcriptional repressor